MRRKVVKTFIFLTILCMGYIFYNVSSREVIGDLSSVPHRETALVLGTGKFLKGNRPNKYYWGRIDAAFDLYKNGKVKKIFISGDNSSPGYNEPEMMKADLMEKGVPAKDITLDYAGFRTLDSIRRAKNVFGVDSPIIVTQYYHAKRALYLCESSGIASAIAYEAPADVPFLYKLRNNSREALAWVKAWLDVNILKKKAKFEK